MPLRFQLPLSYLAMSLLTSLALGVIVLFGLQLAFSRQERSYLHQSARLVAENLAPLLADGRSAEVVEAQLERLARLLGSRVRLLDEGRRVVLEAGGLSESIPPLVLPVPPVPFEPRGVTALPSLLFVPDLPAPPLFYGDRRTEVRWLQALFPSSDELALSSIEHPETGRLLGFAELASERSFTGILSGVALIWGAASLLVLLIATGFGWQLSRRLTEPLLVLTSATRSMAEGDLSARAVLSGDDEIVRLAGSFNRMADRLEASIETLQRFVADAAHALNTPLTALRSNLELGVAEHEPASRQALLELADAQVVRLQTMVGDLLTLARLENADEQEAFTRFDLAESLRNEGELFASRADQLGIALALVLPPDPAMVCARRIQIDRAVAILVDNALKFTPVGGCVEIALERDGAGGVAIVVEDSGIGIPGEDLPFLFERFRRGRNVADYPGSGLGLAIARTIADGHRGSITLMNTDCGTRFRLWLPTGPCHPPA